MQHAISLFIGTTSFTDFIQEYGYIGIFIWFITIDQVSPIPEEISLLSVGYLCAHEGLNPVLAGFTCLAGFIAADVVYFYVSRKGAKFFTKKPGKSSPSWLVSYREKIKSNMPKTIAILNFIPRVRMWAPILAGSLKLSFKRFLLFDTLSLIIFTIIYLLLGIIFSDSLSGVMTKMKGVQNIIFIAALGITALVIFIMMRKKKRNLKAQYTVPQSI